MRLKSRAVGMPVSLRMIGPAANLRASNEVEHPIIPQTGVRGSARLREKRA
jgi:hypothetical protein